MYLVLLAGVVEIDEPENENPLAHRVEGSPAHRVSFDVDKASNFRIGEGLRAFDLGEMADYIREHREIS